MSNGRGTGPGEAADAGLDLVAERAGPARQRRVRSASSGRAGRTAPGARAVPNVAPQRFVAPATHPVRNPLVALRIHVADRALVEVGASVEVGQPLLERCRDTVVTDVPSRPAWASLKPGDVIDAAHLEGGGGSHGPKPGDRARFLFHGPDGRDRVALGRHVSIVTSPVDGSVASIEAGALLLRATGLALAADVGWGQPVSGQLVIGVASPDAELRASAVDIGAAGAIIVAGARLDIEALTRARAIGAAGIICGGVVGRELRQLEESDRRQRAALHMAAPFALIALDGYGRRPIPGPMWDVFLASAGRRVGLIPEDNTCVISGDPDALLKAAEREAQSVRISAGDGLGLEGRLVGLAGSIRLPGGLYAPGGFVDLLSIEGEAVRRVVPLADLERFG